MTMQTDAPDAQDEEVQAGSDGQETESTPSAAEVREKELRDRLAAQGRELKQTREAYQALGAQLAETNAHVKLLGESLTQQQRDADARRQAETQAYLDSLPEDSPQRLREEVRLSNERVARLETQVSGRNDRSQTDTSGSPSTQPKKETPEQYQARRMREIINEAQDEFGVTISRAELEAIPEDDWEKESSFHRAVFATAARKSAAPRTAETEGDDVANKGKAAAPKAEPKETQADMEARVRQSVLRELGVSSAASPRATATRRNGPPPSEDDVKEAASTYNSGAGPKANIARLKKLREQMG